MCQCPCQQQLWRNPNQMEFPEFETRFVEEYRDGYEGGINWDANWMPGGPHVYSGRNTTMRENSKLAAQQWLKGFDVGLAERLKTNAHFAEWWKRNRGKDHRSPNTKIEDVRYTAPESVVLLSP